MKTRGQSAGQRQAFRDLVLMPVAVVAYSVLLHVTYSQLVSPSFGYLGYRYSQPNLSAAVLTVVLTYICSLALPLKLVRPSATVLWILFVVAVAPIVLMSPYTGLLDETTALTLSGTVTFSFVLTCVITRAHRPGRGWRMTISSTDLWLVLGIISAITYVTAASTVGLSLEFVGLLDVYDVREQYVSELQGAGLLSYLLITQSNVINPFIMARGIYSGRWSLVMMGVVGQMVLYSATGFKTILFSVAAIFVIALIHRSNLRPSGALMLWGATSLVAVASLVDSLSSSNLLTSLFARRFLMTPGMLTTAYVAFFDQNPKALLDHSILEPWVQYPYDTSPPRLIATFLINSPATSMNANLFADGFANFGWLGIVGAGLVLAAYLCILDWAARGLS
ncbi:MAG: hypothetical protein U1C73_13215, partial [Dietzia sp.]|nr:hypothetical protein [Dietzia sp.]